MNDWRDKLVSILWLLAAAMMIGACIGVSARADPSQVTAMYECEYPDGNTDGSWCTYTAPNGQKFFIHTMHTPTGPQQGGDRFGSRRGD